MGRYNDLVMLSASREKHNSFMVSRFSRLIGRNEITEEEMEDYAFLLVVYGILEESFTLYKKKWIDNETWEQWAAWLGLMTDDPKFMLIHASSRGMFDKGFEEYIEKLDKERKDRQASDK